MPIANDNSLALQNIDQVIRKTAPALTRQQRSEEAAKLAGQAGSTAKQLAAPKAANQGRRPGPPPSAARTKQDFTAKQRSGLAQNVNALLHQTMEPVSAHLARLPVVGFMPTIGTALARTVDTYSRDFSGYTSVNPSLASHLTDRNGRYSIQNDLGVEPIILLRDPVVSHIQRTIQKLGSGDPKYKFEFAFIGNDVINPDDQNVGALCALRTDCTVYLPVAAMTHISGPRCYGDTCPGGAVGGTRVFWADANGDSSVVGETKLIISLTIGDPAPGAYPTAANLKAALRHHHSITKSEVVGGTDFESSVPGTYTATVYVLSSGYHSIEITPTGNGWSPAEDSASFLLTSISCTLQVRAETTFQHVMPEALIGKEDIVRKARVNGSSVLIQNTSAEQARGGTVYATQIVGDVPWYEMLLDPRSISNANPVTRYVGDWAKGFYGYVKPQGTSPMEMLDVWDDLDSPVDHLHQPLFRPFNNIGTVVVLIQPPSPLEGTFSPTQYTLHVVRAYEFTSTDQFFDVEPPFIPVEDYDSYVQALSTMPQFYENPLHLAAIGTLIARAAGLVVKYGPRAVELAKMYFVAKDVLRGRRFRQ
jgi:hypothetical protein